MNRFGAKYLALKTCDRGSFFNSLILHILNMLIETGRRKHQYWGFLIREEKIITGNKTEKTEL